MAKQVFILAGREIGAAVTELASIINLDPSTVSRSCDAAKLRLALDAKLRYAKELVEQRYNERLKELHV